VDKKSNKQLNPEEREELFADNFEEIDPSFTLVELLRVAGRYLERILGKQSVTVGMKAMLLPDGSDRINPDDFEDWEDLLHEVAGTGDGSWPLIDKLNYLAAYAYYGFASPPEDYLPVRSTDELLENLVSEAKELVEQTPLDQWLDEGWRARLVELVVLSENRWELDNGRPIEPAALARFGGVTEARIRNMMARGSSQFTNKEGLIPAHEALAWLSDRETFFDSIWREQPYPRFVPEETLHIKPVFLPVARDGSVFHPGLARKNGFQIGPKGDERFVEAFEEALEQLHRMEIPYWRRPNEKGKPGIVRGIKWERYDLNDLPAFLIGFERGETDD
jgi:hypothetical protein